MVRSVCLQMAVSATNHMSHHKLTLLNPNLTLLFALLRPCSSTIRNAFLLLLLATSTWLCGLLAVNNSILAFYYIFNVLCLVQVRHNIYSVFGKNVKPCFEITIPSFLLELMIYCLSFCLPGPVSDAGLHCVQLRGEGSLESCLFG